MRTELLRKRYEPLEVVGSGRRGRVLRALDRQHGRLVALKVRPAPTGSRDAAALARRGSSSPSSRIPGLPLVRDDFFVRRRVRHRDGLDRGHGPRALLAERGHARARPRARLRYLEQAAEALEHLHGHDPPVVHGDVKPANLILTSPGRVVLVDFGLRSRPATSFAGPGPPASSRPRWRRGEADRGGRRLLARRDRLHAPRWGGRLRGARRAGAPSTRSGSPALERIVRREPGHRSSQRRDPSAPAFVARLQRWWGGALPSGTVTLLARRRGLARKGCGGVRATRSSRAHRGHCISPRRRRAARRSASRRPRTAVDARARAGGPLRRACRPPSRERQSRGPGRTGDPASGRALETGRSGTGRDRRPDRRGARRPAAAGARPRRGARRRGADEPSGVGARRRPALSTLPRADICPYRGLMAFGSEDGDLYFGREEVVASILDRLLETGFMGVVGASGSGKSSLVRAGLVPAYRRAHDARCRRDDARSGAGRGARAVARRWPALAPGRGPARGGLHALPGRGGPGPLLRGRAGPARDGRRVDRGHPPGGLLRPLRRPPSSRRRARRPPRLLGPMRIDELRRAIEGPAEHGRASIRRGVSSTRCSRDVEGEPGALPLLSHALYESWARREGRVLTTAGYRAAGGVRGAIAHTAEEVFLGCSELEQALMRSMLLRLTELGDATEDSRRRVPLSELIPDGGVAGRRPRCSSGSPPPGSWSSATTRPRSPTRR